MILTMKKNFGASKWSQFEYEKNNFSGFETRYKDWFIIDFLLLLYRLRFKTQRIRNEGFSFADKSPGTDHTYAV